MIITIGRQTGSGGHRIAKLVAERLGYKFYDREILNMAAEDSCFDRSFFEKYDEKHGFFRNFFGLSVATGSVTSYSNDYSNRLSQEALYLCQAEAIRRAAADGDCVFIGRCADYVLRDFPDMVSVFITSDLADRALLVASRTEMTVEQAEKFIRHREETRASFYKYYTGKKWGDSASYDLCINTSKLTESQVVEIICNYVFYFEKKQRS